MAGIHSKYKCYSTEFVKTGIVQERKFEHLLDRIECTNIRHRGLENIVLLWTKNF